MKIALEFVILCNNHWLKIVLTAWQKSIFRGVAQKMFNPHLSPSLLQQPSLLPHSLSASFGRRGPSHSLLFLVQQHFVTGEVETVRCASTNSLDHELPLWNYQKSPTVWLKQYNSTKICWRSNMIWASHSSLWICYYTVLYSYSDWARSTV